MYRHLKAGLAIFLIISLVQTNTLLSHIQKIEIHELELKECLLPKEHSLQNQLKGLFRDPLMFKSPQNLEKAGFKPFKSDRKEHVMIARHPHIPNYLIKKFRNRIPQSDQLANYIKRVNGARHLRKFFDLNHLTHVVVPQKWIYRLPKQFSDPETKEPAYILIVEDMNICTKPMTIENYRAIPLDVLRELCIVIYYFRGFDSIPNNLPFTQDNKIAFIDTEKYDDWNREHFLPRLASFLSEERREQARTFYEELRLDTPHRLDQ